MTSNVPKRISLCRLIEHKRPLVVAHKGASGLAPENTMAAFELALSTGADSIELDVQLSRDRVPVVIHDSDLGRTVRGEGLVSDLTAAELAVMDAGSWCHPRFAGQGVPMLQEVLEWAKGRIPLHIELKKTFSAAPDVVSTVVDLVQRFDVVTQVEVFSFDYQCIQLVKEAYPVLMTGVCFKEGALDYVGLAHEFGIQVLHPEWQCVNKNMVGKAHEMGLYVIAWTVDDPEQTRTLVSMGVDGITTNFP